jgi:hypothetical protein
MAGAALIAAPVCFVAVALVQTTPAQSLARAAAAGGAALALLGSGGALWKLRPASRGVANAALATDVALLLMALATQLPGVSVTLSWAAVGLAAAWLAAATGDKHWMYGAVVVFALALVRVVFRDAATIEHDRAAFEWSLGQQGALFPATFANVRAIALLGVGAGLLGSAWALRGAAPASDRRTVGGAMATVGYAVLLVDAVFEVRGLLTTYPPLPGGTLDAAQFEQYLALVQRTVESQTGRRAVGATLVLGATGLALLTGGFGARSFLHRWLGLLVLGGTVLKLALWDVWTLTRLQQVMVLVGVGALLLGAGYLYARLGSRLIGLFGPRPRSR